MNVTRSAILPSLIAAACALSACKSHAPEKTPSAAAYSAPSDQPPFFDNLGGHTRKVTTSSSQAQRYFNQALIWTDSYNHDEAIRSFEYASAQDPSCAMAHWGIAYCNGPHINNPAMTEKSSRAAWAALQKAQANAPGASPVEQALIAALAARYVDPDKPGLPLDPAARASLDRAYSDAMADVYRRFPSDADVACLYAESMMDLRPWDLWSLDGQPRPETNEIVRVLQEVLASDPDHPAANHFYIHAVEASRRPELADGAASRLRTLVPASGHMVHMPAHVDVRLGRWGMAADQNERAIAAHERYLKRSPRQGLYRAYMFHNDHFLTYACMMEGREQDSIRAVKRMIGSIPEDFYTSYAPVADAYLSIRTEVLIRFGKWDDILKEPRPRADLPITRANWRFARGVAHAAMGNIAAARAEQKLFRDEVAAIPATAHMAINPAQKVLSIGDHMLEGEILYRESRLAGGPSGPERSKLDAAISEFNQAIAIEDTLQYIEPPDWVQPVRHTLGAILLDAGRPVEAETVYREDLRRWAENGWSLFGLSRALAAQGKTEAAAEYEKRFATAWKRADTKLTATCLCVTPKPPAH